MQLTVHQRLVLQLQSMYPTESDWLEKNWTLIEANINYAKAQMNQSTVTQTLQKRARLCSPHNPTCNGIALPSPDINHVVHRNAESFWTYELSKRDLDTYARSAPSEDTYACDALPEDTYARATPSEDSYVRDTSPKDAYTKRDNAIKDSYARRHARQISPMPSIENYARRDTEEGQYHTLNECEASDQKCMPVRGQGCICV